MNIKQFWHTLGTFIIIYSKLHILILKKEEKKCFNVYAFILRLKQADDIVALELTNPNLFTSGTLRKAPNQLTQTENSSQWMHECLCIHLPAELLLCLGACVSLCKNVINPGAVSFSARYGKIGAEYLFTAHPFKTWGLFLFVRLERRRGM